MFKRFLMLGCLLAVSISSSSMCMDYPNPGWYEAPVPEVILSPSQEWIIESLRCMQQFGSWIVADKHFNNVVVQGEMISENSNIIRSNPGIETLSAMHADVMQVTNAKLESFIEIWIYSRIKEICTWKSRRDWLYDYYIQEIGKKITYQYSEPAYIFTISEQAADGSLSLLGSVMFCMLKDMAYGDIELDHFVIKPQAQQRGLGTILASAIFKILPQIKRITLDVHRTNLDAQAAYKSLGFTQFYNGRYEHSYEYLTNKCSRLQNVAASFQPFGN